ncbi:MAG: SDR family NAD(P)-dependent oxidoreductase [Bacteroidota bacterium]
MLTLALAYSAADQSMAHRITGDLASHVTFDHFSVSRANEGPVLADLLRNYDGRVVALISEDFLTNPNCMLRGHELFGSNREVLPVFLLSEVYDELTDEKQLAQTSLRNQAEVMQYVNHWQDRYIDLRRESEELAASGGEAFKLYLRKIRETSVQAEELLHMLKDSWSLTQSQFTADHYHQLFIFAERPRLWEEYQSFDDEAPIDLSGIPGLEMLSGAKRVEEARPQVPGEEEQQGKVTEYPPATEELLPTDENNPMTEETNPVLQDPPETTTPEPQPATKDISPDEQVNTWIERAWRMHDQGDAAAGLELLNAGRDALPERLELHYHYALLLATATEDVPAARQEVEALLDKHPDHLDGLYLNGELALAADDIAATRDNWEALSDLEPFYPGLNQRLGTFLADHFPEDYLDAAAYLRRATKDKAPNADAFYRYALLLAGPVGRKKKAMKMLRQAVILDPNHAFAHYELAVLLHERGDLKGARNAFQLAGNLNPAFKTRANERAFAMPAKSATVLAAATSAEEDALSALKRNLAELENMIAERDAAPEPDPAPAPAPGKGYGKTVLISGATAGIGRATARRLAAEDFRLILIGRRAERLEMLAKELADQHGTESHLLELDVRDQEKVAATIEALPPDWAHIDVLLNNAGKAKGVDPIHEGKIEHWEEMVDVNVKGLLYLTRAVSPAMVERQDGMIINVCSTAGKEVYPNGNVYCATKHAVDALTHAARLDLVKYGIRVGQICPAMVEETEFSLVRYDGDAERAKIYEDFQPLRSSDVAEAICFMITQPRHVNILDMVLQGTQQASSTMVDRSGRARFAPEEE